MTKIVKLSIDYVDDWEPFLFCAWFGRSTSLLSRHAYHRLDGPARYNIKLNDGQFLAKPTYWYNGTKFEYLTWKFAVERHRQRKEELRDEKS